MVYGDSPPAGSPPLGDMRAGTHGNATSRLFTIHMQLRPYQQEAVTAILTDWKAVRKTLLVLPTGTGKTIVFSALTAEIVAHGGRVLILAHRAELLQQAADKLKAATGLGCAVEKAEQTAEESWYNVTVGSIQSFNEKRLERISPSDYTHIIIDEAHHVLSDSYQRVMAHFPDAKVLGVTATADRGDKRNLGQFFETVAFEMSLPRAVREGWLVPIQAETLPVELRISHTGGGDYTANECSNALEPYLDSIADAIQDVARDRKTVCFLPLIATSQKFCAMLNARGIEAKEVNGESEDRAEVLEWFHQAGPGCVLCNSMLLTEGWDEPSADCICVLRPTKVRALYAQMVGRGTRLSPGKEDLLLLDFLWMTEKHDLCRPVHLVCKNPELLQRMAEIMAEETKGEPQDLLECAEEATGKAQEEREETLRRELEEQRHRKRALVDPLQFEMSITPDGGRGKIVRYEPDENDLASLAPPSPKQLAALEKAGIFPDDIRTTGEASRILDIISKRRSENLTTPKQIRFLEGRGFNAVGTWGFDQARRLIDRIAGNGWRVPHNIDPYTYTPQ